MTIWSLYSFFFVNCIIYVFWIIFRLTNLDVSKVLFILVRLKNYQLLFFLVSAIFMYVISLLYFYFFDQTFSTFQANITVYCNYWFNFDLGLDLFGFLFFLLLFLIIPICILVHYSAYLFQGWSVVNKEFYNHRCYYLLLLLVNSQFFLLSLFCLIVMLFFFFSILDIFSFYIFFEGALLPIFLIIGYFGSRLTRIRAAYYLLFYTLASSLFFFLGIFYLYNTFGTTNFLLLSHCIIPVLSQNWLWLSIFIPIAVKIPILPFHLWLPEAHVEAPTEGSVLLAGLLLKLGGYAFLRFIIPLFPLANSYFMPVVLMISSLSLLYISILIFKQADLKKIIAYSSIAHMNFALLGLFTGTVQGLEGAIYLFFTHGLISSGLFICIGFLYQRYHTRIVFYYAGLLMILPLWAFYFFIFILGNLSFPGTGGFVAELLLFLGIFSKNLIMGLLSIISSFFCTVYSFLLFTRICFGVGKFAFVDKILLLPYLHFLTKIEYLILTFLSGFVLYTGFCPNTYLLFINSYSYYMSFISF